MRSSCLIALCLVACRPASQSAPVSPGTSAAIADDEVLLGPEAVVAAPSAQGTPAAWPERIATAQRHLQAARAADDTRALRWAERALGPDAAAAPAPPEARLLYATILQRAHRFEEAEQLLTALLEDAPEQGAAWLTLASVRTVRGRLGPARDACARVATTLDPLASATCFALVEGMHGRAREAAARLTDALAEGASSARRETLVWSLTALAELLDRGGDPRGAEQTFRSALRVGPDDRYLRVAWADFLLDEKRPEEVLPLFREPPEQLSDAALVRLAIAQRQAAHPGAEQTAALLKRRFDAARAAGDRGHLREEALYLLRVRGDAAGAAPVALENFALQREGIDVRLLMEATAGTESAAAHPTLLAWLADTGYQDARVRPLLGGGSPPPAREASR